MIASVLERFLYSKRFSHVLVFFILGVVFSLLAIFLALQTKVGFVALFIIAIAILPVVNRRISLSALLAGRITRSTKSGVLMEDITFRAKRWKLSQFFSDFWPLFEVYLVYFVTVFAAFILLGAWLDFGSITSIFELQFGIFRPGMSVSLEGLLINNLGVLFLGFLISFVFEFGTTFVVVRNAIFWGLTLGIFMTAFPGNFLSLLLILPHLLLEASSYFVSSIAGGVLSKAVTAEKISSERFYSLFTQVASLLLVSVVLVLIAGLIEVIVFNSVLPQLL
ncbi:stage II sporulation protein M [Candidatus Micrarchaeota archaeon]|nr:stage II sporulation protein M [Candidatus Micrarchaeota archaeon]MBU1930838.1 stage II sporulation protein M [Candidatus Micrarchaeota archaeon]